MTEAQDAVQARPENTPAEATGWYLYGITLPNPTLTGVLREVPGFEPDVTTPQIIPLDSLAAVVRAVTLSDFAPETLAERAGDPVWLEQMVRSHNDVIAAVHALQAILPAKFGSIFAGTSELRAAVVPMRDELATQLDRLRDADEWAVHVFADPSVVEQRVAAESETIRALRQEAQEARPGRAYFLQRKIADQTARETEAALGEIADLAFNRLAPYAYDAEVSATVPSSRNEAGRLEILKAAFLVPRDDLDAFVRAVSDLEGNEDEGTAECSGPWPPYSFAGEGPA